MSDLTVPEGTGAAPLGTGRPPADVQGVQVGDFNVQTNYFYNAGRLTDGASRPPLVDGSGRVESPYRGLGHFEARDARFFHGREAATGEILARMSAAAQGSGLLLVSGVSGAGKSSLLRAGVLPRVGGEGLASAPGAGRWAGLVLTPTWDPLAQLALRTAHLLGTDAVRVREHLSEDPSSFALIVRQLALQSSPDGDGAGRVLLIVDQFEEIFTQCTDQGLRRKFVAALSAAAASGVALVMLVVRADFHARCADFPELTAAARDGYLVTAMGELELRAAIVRPVTALNDSSGVEESLVSYLVREMLEVSAGAGDPTSGAGALPLLSHALDQAWRNRTGKVLTLDDYARGGRIQGAVAASAQRAFESLGPAERDVARPVFLRLVTTSDEGTLARDRVPRDELLAVAGPGRQGDVARLLDAFTRERLTTQAAANVEISHDALLTAWPLLRDEWLAESYADLNIRKKLRSAARDWEARSRKPGSLYRDEVLDEAIGAAHRIVAAPGRHFALSPQENAFLWASAQEQRNKARVRKRVRGGFAALIVVLTAAVAFALTAQHSANRDLSAADVQQMSEQSVALRGIDPAVSALAAAAAWWAAPSEQTRDVGVEAATNSLIGQFDAAAGPVAVSPDGSLLAVGDPSAQPVAGAHSVPAVTLWSLTELEVVGYIPLPVSVDGGTGAYSVAFSPAAVGGVETLAVSTEHGVKLYQVRGSSYRLLQTLPAGLAAGLPAMSADDPVAFRKDGMLAVAVTAAGGDIELFAGVKGRYASTPTDVIPNTQDVTSLSFGPDGSLAVGTPSGVAVYPAANGYSSPPVTTGEQAVNGSDAQFNGAGLLAVSSSTGTTVDSYTAGALTSVPLAANQGTVAALSDDNVLAVAETGELHLYLADDLATAGFIDTVTVPYPGLQAPADIAFSPNGAVLVENIDGEVYVYDTRALTGTLRTIVPAPRQQAVMVLGFDPSDTAILAMGTQGAIELVNVSDGKVIAVPGTANASSASFTPSGALAVVTSGGVLLFPDPLTSADHSQVPGTAGAAQVAFSQAGDMAVVGVGPSGLTVYPPGNFSPAAAMTPRVTSGAGTGARAFEDAVFGPGGQLAVVVATGASQAPNGVAVFAPGTYAEQGYIPDSSLAFAVCNELLAFAPDGTLAIGDTAGIGLYAPGTFQDPKIIAGVKSIDDSGYGWLAFSRDGILLSEDSSAGVSLWDGATGRNLATINASADGAAYGEQLAVSPDGRYLAYESAVNQDTVNQGASYDYVTLIWSTPYLDGNAADGVRFLCDEHGGASGVAQWSRYFTSGLASPGTCR